MRKPRDGRPWAFARFNEPQIMTQPPKVVDQSYGKSQVRLSRIQRLGQRHEFFDLTFWIELDGDFVAAYTDGDNSKVVATDTMKNTVYLLASKHRIEAIESFTQLICRHFLTT